MISTRVITDGGVLIVETDRGTEAEIRAVIQEVWTVLNPQTISCESAHPFADIMCADPHPVGGGDYRLELVGLRS